MKRAIKRFEPWLHKIIYIPCRQSAEGLLFEAEVKTYSPGNASWKLENGQRNALLQISDKISDEDIVMVGDFDEIPDPSVIKKTNLANDPKALSQLFHNKKKTFEFLSHLKHVRKMAYKGLL